MLAAGRGHRFGGDKLLALLQGRPLVAHVLDTLARARDAGILVEGRMVVAPGQPGLGDLAVTAGVEPVVNVTPDRGLSSSLRCGLAALGPYAGAAVVLLGDQPLVQLDVVAALVAAWRERRGEVIRPRYAQAPDQPGHPVLLDRSVWPLAAKLEGEAGFGALFPPGATGLALIDVPGRNPDIDTPADLDTLKGPWP